MNNSKFTKWMRLLILHLSVLVLMTCLYSCTRIEIIDVNGQYVVKEQDRPVLQYNHQTVHEKDVIRPQSQIGQKIEYFSIGSVTTAIYAVPRSDYIHPLYGPEGEMLTSDWPDAHHPHHRGVFWAWPEVRYGSKRGDIYALQRIFARPANVSKNFSNSGYVELKADNKWMWEDKTAIVDESVTIRVYNTSKERRIIDLTVRLQALVDSVTIATRSTNSYGGFGIRMATPKDQTISHHIDTVTASPVRCWADFSGIFEGSQSTSGMTILQHKDNPEYPGPWIDYPNLSWIQPVFPTPNTRYPLSINKPLILRYRLIVHKGGKPDDAVLAKQWDEYNSINN